MRGMGSKEGIKKMVEQVCDEMALEKKAKKMMPGVENPREHWVAMIQYVFKHGV